MITDDQARMQQLREQAKARLSQASESAGELSQEELRELVHDYQVHQIELELQNEELRTVLQELQETKDQLALTRDRYARLFENAPVGYLVVDANELIVQANQTFADMTGQDPQWLHGVSFTDFIDPEDHGAFHGRYRAFFKHPEGKELDFRLLGKNGELHVRCTARVEEEPPTTTPGEPLKRILLVVQDVSSRIQAEKALRNSEQQYRELYEDAPVGIFESTPEGRYLGLNPEYARIAGYSSPEAMMTGIANIAHQLYLHPEHRDHFNRLLITDGHVRNYETELKRPDGTTFWVSVDTRTKRGEQGQISYVGFLTDITKRKLAEKALRISEERYKTIVTSMNDLLFVIDAEDRFIDIHCQSIDRLLLPPEAFLGKTMDQIMPESIAESFRHAASTVRRDGGSQCYEYPLLLNGEEKWFLSCLDLHSDGETIIAGVRDITDRKLADEALRESEARFRNLFEHLPTVAVQGYGMDGVTRFWNKASEIFYGYSAEEALGRNLLDLIIPEEMRQHVVQEINAMFPSGKPIPAAELDLMRKDGSRIHVYSSHAIVQRPAKEPELFCIDVDLTELKQAETALIQAKEHAEAANKAKSEFLANMSHEIRTPLNGMSGMMQLLLTTTLSPEQSKYVHLAVTSANRLTRLLSDILDLSRVEAGMTEVLESEFLTQDVCNSVTDLFAIAAQDKHIALECIMDSKVPDRLVGDEARVRQVLFNLVGNALKFTNKGGVRIQLTSLSPAKGSDARILFSITDTGIGIPVDKMDSLFKPFVQVDGSYTRSYQGAGLGLAIVRRLVELMGGNISVESTEGQGTTVHVVLPFKLP
jgi:PAS domain S-box-containing protein